MTTAAAKPSLDDIAIFAAVARTLNLTRAAKELQLPKSSVSRALARLERTMDAELIHRTTRNARLTAIGEALLNRTEPLLSALTDSVAEIPREDKTPAGLLRITCTIDYATTVLAEIITRFVALWPKLRVEVHAANGVVDLVKERFDVAIRFTPKRRLRDSSLVARRVGTLRSLLVASPSYLAERGTPRTPAQLVKQKHDWVTYQGIESVVLESPSESEELAARARLVCDDMFFVRAAARAGAGVATLPSFLAEPEIEAGLLTRVLPGWEVPSGAIWLVHPPSQYVPAKVTAFRDFLVSALSSKD